MKEFEYLKKENFDFEKYVDMVKSYQKKGDHTGWFDNIYKSAQGDFSSVFWADLEPSPYLVNWLKKDIIKKKNKKACVIGCGVGDDAKALEEFGFEVTAFDISPCAIKLCKDRYKDSKVNFVVADLFDYPKEWFEAFDVVYECNTIQVLSGNLREKARKNMCSLLAKNGYILVSCRSRNEAENEDLIPLPLSKSEIDKFVTKEGLKECEFLAYDDNQTPQVPHFFGVYFKVASIKN